MECSALSDPRDTQTDSTGGYRFDGVPAGRCSLVYSTHLGNKAISLERPALLSNPSDI